MSVTPHILEVSRGAPILDYAAPQSRGRVRLPARSDIVVSRSPGLLRIHETLAGRVGAAFAILFALVTLAILISVGIEPFYGKHLDRHVVDVSLCFTVAAAEVFMMLAVIDNTWRTTTLTLTHDDVQLVFRSPLRGSTKHRWNTEKLRSAYIRQTRLQEKGPEFSEIELDIWGEAQVRLFLGHRLAELQELLAAIHDLQPPSTPLPMPKLPNPATS